MHEAIPTVLISQLDATLLRFAADRKAENLASFGRCTLARSRIVAPSSPIVVDTQPISASSRQPANTMAAMTSTMQLARSAVPARSVSRSCPAAAQSAMFGSRLAVRPAAAQVTRFHQVQSRHSLAGDGSDPRVVAVVGRDLIQSQRAPARVCQTLLSIRGAVRNVFCNAVDEEGCSRCHRRLGRRS